MKPNVVCTRTEVLQNSVVSRHSAFEDVCVFLGKELAVLVLRHTLLRKAVLAECRGVGLGVCRLGS